MFEIVGHVQVIVRRVWRWAGESLVIGQATQAVAAQRISASEFARSRSWSLASPRLAGLPSITHRREQPANSRWSPGLRTTVALAMSRGAVDQPVGEDLISEDVRQARDSQTRSDQGTPWRRREPATRRPAPTQQIKVSSTTIGLERQPDTALFFKHRSTRGTLPPSCRGLRIFTLDPAPGGQRGPGRGHLSVWEAPFAWSHMGFAALAWNIAVSIRDSDNRWARQTSVIKGERSVEVPSPSGSPLVNRPANPADKQCSAPVKVPYPAGVAPRSLEHRHA